MSDINKLDVMEFDNYKALSSDIGLDSKMVLFDYNQKLSEMCENDFSSDDESAVHEVVEALLSEIQAISDSMYDADFMIDSLINLIKNNIIEREDKLASTAL